MPFADLLTLPAAREVRLGTAAKAGIVLASVAAGAAIFALKFTAYRRLGTTDDLFQFAQLAVSWLHGSFLHDNHYGNHLSIHTYFLAPALAILVLPLGVPGLLLAASLAAGLGTAAMARIAIRYGVPAWLGIAVAVVATLMPFSLNTYYDVTYGFHIELLEPGLVLWLAYFVLERRWVRSVTMCLVILAIKEDAPLVIIPIATAIFLESLLGAWLRRDQRGTKASLNWVAVGVAAMALAAVPALLLILHGQTPGPYSPGSFSRLRVAPAGQVTGPLSVVAFGWTNSSTWLHSKAVGQWFSLWPSATLGLAILRPQLLIVGLPTTLISWLMATDLQWAPYFTHPLAVYQLMMCFGLISVVHFLAGASIPRALPWVAGLAAIAVGYHYIHEQLKVNPEVPRLYALDPKLPLAAGERREADLLFSRYETEHRAGEPVIASLRLFKYADYRDLYWYGYLEKRPHPEWILWDLDESPLANLRGFLSAGGADFRDYKLLESRSHFALFRQMTPEEKREAKATAKEVTDRGAIKLRVQLPQGPSPSPEPLVAAGEAGAATMAFLRVLPDGRISLGVEFWGAGVVESDPFSPEVPPGGTAEIVVAAPIFFPPAGDALWQGVPPAEQEARGSRVRILFDGKMVLDRPIVHAPQRQTQVDIGANNIGGSFVAPTFRGKVLESSRVPLPGP